MFSRDTDKNKAYADAPVAGIKRTGNTLPSPRKRRSYSPIDTEQQQQQQQQQQRPYIPEGGFYVRWLIESSVCARVLGPSGKRLKHMKESTKEPSIQARISPKVQDAEYRVFNCAGSTMGISKIAGLLVRYIYDEPENELSQAESCRYDLKLLIPKKFVESLVGTDGQNLREIEERSNAAVSIEKDCLPSSNEVCLHLFGVADAVQIAVYFTLETLKSVESALGINSRDLEVQFFDPKVRTRLDFKEGRQSDFIPRARVMALGGGMNDNIHQNERPTLSSGSSNAINASDTTSTTMADSLELPQLNDDNDVPQSVYTAYDIARDSKRSNLRQIVQIDSSHKRTEEDRSFLVENIRRVTTCQIIQGIDEPVEHFEDDKVDDGISLIIDGPPEENSVALLLIYRFLKNKPH